jgi:beta-glucosidase-like glycosyl hydrolase
MVMAMQTPDSHGHPRVQAYLKHLDAYSTETNRMHSDYNITQFDFWDSYLPQYEKVFTEAKAAGWVLVLAESHYIFPPMFWVGPSTDHVIHACGSKQMPQMLQDRTRTCCEIRQPTHC